MSFSRTIEKLEGFLTEIDSLLVIVQDYEKDSLRYETFLKHISTWVQDKAILEGGRMIRTPEGLQNVYDALVSIDTESHTDC